MFVLEGHAPEIKIQYMNKRKKMQEILGFIKVIQTEVFHRAQRGNNG